MERVPVIAIFDIGKTNKKLFLFDEDYKIVFERSARFAETVDEDGDACENVESLRMLVFDSLGEVLQLEQYDIKAINFSTYGASFVYIDEKGETIAPLYNYLKAYPEHLKTQFYGTYGGETEFSYRTASPVLGSLNSGMQLYRIKYEKPQLFHHIKSALHLPQYLSYLLSGRVFSDITSIGCHTNLWDFAKNDYHDWVKQEGILEKLPPIFPSNEVLPAEFPVGGFAVGIGLHDSSAALIPYLVSFREPFVLISTGTWCISLNPFNQTPLTKEELLNDCLCYMSFEGKPVKASRLFAGYEHEQEVKRIATHFQLAENWYYDVEYNPELIAAIHEEDQPEPQVAEDKLALKQSGFAQRDLGGFDNAAAAYHRLIYDIACLQFLSTQMVLKGPRASRLFVDGGFSRNTIYMNLLASFFPGLEVYAASMAQATAVGTALSVHRHWNSKPLPADLVELKKFEPGKTIFKMNIPPQET